MTHNFLPPCCGRWRKWGQTVSHQQGSAPQACGSCCWAPSLQQPLQQSLSWSRHFSTRNPCRPGQAQDITLVRFVSVWTRFVTPLMSPRHHQDGSRPSQHHQHRRGLKPAPWHWWRSSAVSCELSREDHVLPTSQLLFS